MGEIRKPVPAVLFVAVSGENESALAWARQALSRKWGPVQFEGDPFDFGFTGYYREQMGDAIIKQLLAFTELIDPEQIVSAKIHANELECEYRQVASSSPVARPVNIDPGYVTEAKLVLATTKNRDHRIYLAKGIFAEVTLFYQQDRWNDSRWTYPDYKTEECSRFLDQCRAYLRKQLRR